VKSFMTTYLIGEAAWLAWLLLKRLAEWAWSAPAGCCRAACVPSGMCLAEFTPTKGDPSE
jgi:hypothetical protein